MRAMIPALADPTDDILQGEQMRAASLLMPTGVALAGTFVSVQARPTSMFVSGDQAGPGTMTTDGPTPANWARPLDRMIGRCAANGGIMTSLGFMPVYANECMINRATQSAARFSISGITRDSAGSVLASCLVRLFGPASEFLGQTTSDGSGNYSFILTNNNGPFFVVAWDVATGLITGASPRTLQPTQV